MTDNGLQNNSICKTCKNRFRRVFIPLNPEEYFAEVDGSEMPEGDNIIIYNQCLITDMDLDNDETIECSAYEKREEPRWVANISI